MKKYAVAGIAAVVVLAAVIWGVGSCAGGRRVDASGYTQAQLDLTFQGETKEAEKFVPASTEELKQMYEDGVTAFVENYLTGGVDTQGTFSNTYGKLTEQIFRAMRYQVGDAKKTEKNTYEVEVTYHPADVFAVFIPQLAEAADKIEEKAAGGEYDGTEEEIQNAMLLDYMSQSYTLLESAYLDMQYGEKETYTFTLTRQKGSSVTMDNEEINEFIEKILALDKL